MAISNNNKKMVRELFTNPDNGFIRLAMDKNSFEDENYVKLLCGVIESGFMTMDFEFFENNSCKNICYALLLDYQTVLYAFHKLEYFEENQMEWKG